MFMIMLIRIIIMVCILQHDYYDHYNRKSCTVWFETKYYDSYNDYYGYMIIMIFLFMIMIISIMNIVIIV